MSIEAIGQMADVSQIIQYHKQLTEYREQLNRSLKETEAFMKECERVAASVALSTEGQTEAIYPQAKVVIESRTVFNATDWDKFYLWVAEDPANRMSGYIQKRLGSTEMKNHLKNNGELPPGIAEAIVTDTKIKHTKPKQDINV